MDCREIQKSLSSYLDGLLSPEEKKLVEGHLPSCVQCSATLAELKKTKDLLRNLDDVEPPPWLAAKIMACVREEKEQQASFFKKLFFPFHIKVPLQALSVILVGVIVFQVYRMVEPERKVSRAPSPSSVLTAQEALREKTPPGIAKSGEAISSQAKQKTTIAGQVTAKKDETAQLISGSQGGGTQKPGAVAVPAEKNAPVMAQTAPEEKNKKEIAGVASAPVQTEDFRQRAYEAQSENAEKPAVLADKKRAEEKPRALAPTEVLKERLACVQLVQRIIVSAPDTTAAKKSAQDMVKQLGGKEIETITQGATETIIAELPSGKIIELSEKLKTLGEIKTEPKLSTLTEGTFRVRIEITPQ